jgi:predicted peroxiredoxin
MGTIMNFSTNGSENPTKAVLPFLNANGAVEAGHEPTITLFGDAVVLMKDSVANAVVPVGWPPLKDILATTIANNTPIYV